MILQKYKSILLFKALLLTVLIACLLPFLDGMAHAETCLDGATEVPETILAGGHEYDFCSSHGGYNGGDASVCNDGTKISDSARRDSRESDFCSGHLGYSGGASTSTSHPTDQAKYVNNDCNGSNLNKDNCGIVKYLVVFIKFLSAIVGIVVVAMIIVGGIQYSASQDDPAAVTAAKKRIFNAILALLVYIFAFAFLQYLIPGGVI